MIRNSFQVAPLPNTVYTSGGGTIALPAAGSVSDPLDVSPGAFGFTIQLEGVTSGAASISVDGSLDEGKTWIDITGSLKSLGGADALVTAPLAADGIFQLPTPFPGKIRLRCAAAGSAAGSGYVNYQDSRAMS